MQRETSFLLLLCCVLFWNCGGDDEILKDPVPVAKFVSATPPGGYIAANGSITVTFDRPLWDLTVSAGTVTTAGKTVTITGPFRPGPLELTLTWSDGTQVLNYFVTAPCCAVPPGIVDDTIIIGSTVKDGDTDVDPEVINTDGKIEITFAEDVIGNITLQTEGGEDVGWIGKVKRNKGILELVKGKELKRGTTYVIKGRVQNAAGLFTDVNVVFVTQAKE